MRDRGKEARRDREGGRRERERKDGVRKGKDKIRGRDGGKEGGKERRKENASTHGRKEINRREDGTKNKTKRVGDEREEKSQTLNVNKSVESRIYLFLTLPYSWHYVCTLRVLQNNLISRAIGVDYGLKLKFYK